MRREYRRPLFLCFGVLLQLFALWRMQFVGGGCDARTLLFEGTHFCCFFSDILSFLQQIKVGRNLQSELHQNIITNLT